MNNWLTAPIVTPQEFQKHIDKVSKVAFAWMHDDKLWGPHISFYAYNIKSHLKKEDTLKIYRELAAIIGPWRVESYVYQFRKTHREVIKSLKWAKNVNIRWSAAASAYTQVRNVQEVNYQSDMKSIGFQTSLDIHETFSAIPEGHIEQDDHIEWLFLTDIEPEEEYPTRRYSDWDDNMIVRSQFSSWSWTNWVKRGATAVEVDGEIMNPHDV